MTDAEQLEIYRSALKQISALHYPSTASNAREIACVALARADGRAQEAVESILRELRGTESKP